MKKVLVTGPSGFIGSHLINFIRDSNRELYSNLVLLSSTKHKSIPSLLHADYKSEISELKNLNVSQVIHMGSFTPKNKNQADDVLGSYSNIRATANLIDSLPEGVERFVYLSSIDVYTESQGPINEKSKVEPNSLYGWSKLYCELMLEKWAAGKGIQCQILRIGHVYGPGEERYQKLIPETIRSIHQNASPKLFTSGEELRNFIYVSDCCDMICNALKLNTNPGPINISSSVSIKVKELIDTLISISKKDLQIEYSEQVSNGRNLVFDNSKMVQYLGKEKTELRVGLEAEYSQFNN